MRFEFFGIVVGKLQQLLLLEFVGMVEFVVQRPALRFFFQFATASTQQQRSTQFFCRLRLVIERIEFITVGKRKQQ